MDSAALVTFHTLNSLSTLWGKSLSDFENPWILCSYLYKAELPPVEHAVDGWNGGDGQKWQEPKTHDPKGNIHLHPPHLLLIPRILHISMDLTTQKMLKIEFIKGIFTYHLF